MLSLYIVYLDVSRGSAPVYTIGGYVASVDQWDRFRPKWLRLLSTYETKMFVPADLDLKDQDGQRIGTYKGWSDEKMLNFQRQAHEIIKSHRRVAVSYSIPINEFRRIKFGWMREEEGLSRLYFFSAMEALKNVARWIKRYKVKNPIQYVFESGDEGYDEVESGLRLIRKDPELRARHNMQSFARAEKDRVVQLQAAGLWAYETYKHLANQYVARGKLPVRDSWMSLYRVYDLPYNTRFTDGDVDGVFEVYKNLGGRWEVQDAELYKRRLGRV